MFRNPYTADPDDAGLTFEYAAGHENPAFGKVLDTPLRYRRYDETAGKGAGSFGG